MTRQDLVTSTTHEGPRYYQHISQGGISYCLHHTNHVRKDWQDFSRTLDLEVKFSNMGITSSFKIPVFATTADVLESIASQIREFGNVEPSYLGAIDASEYNQEDHKVGEFLAPRKAQCQEKDKQDDEDQDSAPATDHLKGTANYLNDPPRHKLPYLKSARVGRGLEVNQVLLTFADAPDLHSLTRTLERNMEGHPADEVPRVGDTWFVRLKNASALAVFEVADVTDYTVLLKYPFPNLQTEQRYMRTDVTFVERTTKGTDK